ncbi:MAG: hypothetical protein ACFCVG_05310 [Kineosporiaceae bacterium]
MAAQRSFPVVVTTPHPGLWREALREAEGDARRIEIVSPTNLVVHPLPVTDASGRRSA